MSKFRNFSPVGFFVNCSIKIPERDTNKPAPLPAEISTIFSQKIETEIIDVPTMPKDKVLLDSSKNEITIVERKIDNPIEAEDEEVVSDENEV